MEGITVNGVPLEKSGYADDYLGRSVVRVPRSGGGWRGSDGGKSRARHNRDDDKVWSDRGWDL
jgi:hypothetical protein